MEAVYLFWIGSEKPSLFGMAEAVKINKAKEMAERAIKHATEFYPDEIVIYELWKFRDGYAPEPFTWDFCYIPPNCDPDKLLRADPLGVPLVAEWGSNVFKPYSLDEISKILFG